MAESFFDFFVFGSPGSDDSVNLTSISSFKIFLAGGGDFGKGRGQTTWDAR